MKKTRRSICLFLVILMVISMSTVSAQTVNFNTQETTRMDNADSGLYTKEEILKLEPYVSVSNVGLFKLDVKKAQKDNIDEELIKGQLQYFEQLNSLIEKGDLKAQKNLEIDRINDTIPLTSYEQNISIAAKAGHWSSCGGGINTSVEYHWWGMSRYACDCVTRAMGSDFASVAAVSTGVAVVATYFAVAPAIPPGLTAAYFALLASRLDANNHGKGTCIGITWAFVFDIEPQ